MVLAIDPSGNFKEGKGTTGFCLFDETQKIICATDAVAAKDYPTQETYWSAVLDYIIHKICKYEQHLTVVCEEYSLYAHKANCQINSKLETPRLIGIIQYICYLRNISVVFQTAAQVKPRWTDEILIYKNYIEPKGKRFILPNGLYVNKHCRDAIRHAVHYATFKGGKNGS